MNRSLVVILFTILCYTSYAKPTPKKFSFGLDYTFQKEPTQNIDINPTHYNQLQNARHSSFVPSITYHIDDKQALGGTIGFGFSNPEGEWIQSDAFLKFNSHSYQLGIFYKIQYPIIKRLNIFAQPNLTAKLFHQVTTQDGPDNTLYWYQDAYVNSFNINLKTGLSFNINEHWALKTYITNDLLSWEVFNPKISTSYRSNYFIFLRKHLVYGIGLNYQFSFNSKK